MSLKQTLEQIREHSIEAWMLTTVRDGGVVRMDDLHIDRIDETWKSRECWIQGGLKAFRLALMLRDRHQFPFTVALGFSLESGEHFTDVNFKNTKELGEKLNWTPPSLYLFEPGRTPRNDTVREDGAAEADVVVRELKRDFFGGSVQPANCYYIEFRQLQSTEYSRSVFLEG